MSYHWVQLRAMIRKDWNQMKAEKCKSISEVVWSILYGTLIGYEVKLQIDEPTFVGLGYLVLLLCCPIIFQQSASYIANQMVKDRETKMKESLKIMGLSPWVYSLGFLIQRAVWMLFTVFFVSFFVWAFNSETYSFSELATFFIALWLFGLGMLTFTMFAQNFFKNSKLITMILPIIFFIPTGLAMNLILRPIIYQEINDNIQFLYWFPTFPFTTIMVNTLDKTGITFFEVGNPESWVFLVLNIPFYFFLHLYVEAIKPDSYGIAQHPCFCCRKRKAQTAQSDMELKAVSPRVEDSEAGLRRVGTEKLGENDPIQLKRVTMKFGNFKAVDDLTMSIKENEIFALLGHNGAGKTTCIYMLTGMLHMTEGQAELYGKSVKDDILEVRKEIGLCQQHDVLYDLVSIKEHLLMTMRIRSGKVDQQHEQEQINDILTRCQLHEHKDKLVRQCSGGMKRKLSLGMALIGQTKTIILDEPTSGLDVESRQQMWDLIRTLKTERSIIMSTQHIEEADHLADRVCIMSHGRIINLDTPGEIKRKYGVGYNIFCEVKHEFENQLDEQAMKDNFDSIRAVFFGGGDLEGIKESSDSNDKKLIIQCPQDHVFRLSELIQKVETNCPQIQIDIELNSLEDAFIKIAMKDIIAEQEKIKQQAQQQLYMSEADEEKAMEEYASFEGNQSFFQKIYYVAFHRMKLFYRDSAQWVSLLIPLTFVMMMSYIFYSFINVTTRARDAQELQLTEEERQAALNNPRSEGFRNDDGSRDTDRIISLMLKILFGFLLAIGSSFTAGMAAILPMEERKGGLRHMMHLFGLNSFQYWLGMALADLVIVLFPATICGILLLFFEEIMKTEVVGEFFLLFWFFGCTLNIYSYAFSHIFNNPETGIKYISMIYSIGLFIGPLVVWAIVAGLISQNDDEGELLQLGYSVCYSVSPLFCFAITTYNIAVRGDELIDEWKIFDGVPTGWVGIGVLSIHIVVIFALVVLIDHKIRNSYKKQGGNLQASAPPLLNPEKDVIEHEQQVREKKDDPDFFQIQSLDLVKTYPGAARMAVCQNTFGVRKHEIYGLLGPNGAGKSTTFSMMAMQTPVTSGIAKLMQHEVTQLPLGQLGKFIGICNQENLMWDNMTVDESLNVVAALKGVGSDLRDRFKRVITQNLDLTPFKDTLCKNLSGGNKRKLCCAQSIMLSPRILFLDEPTCGVDPVSRRALNKMVKRMKNASVLLTTHRMDEAEQLCDKIAIMINGRFVVVGSPNYLKSTYGHGYNLTIRQTRQDFNNPTNNICENIKVLMPQAALVHSEGMASPLDQFNREDVQNDPQAMQRTLETRFKIYDINGQKGENSEVEGITLSYAFDKLAQMLERGIIKDFALTRTTMGEVFTDFAKFQIDGAAKQIE